MTIACALCRKQMGEKCPKCGERASRFWLFPMFLCWNFDCGVWMFFSGRGGRSDTICNGCLERMAGREPVAHGELQSN